jgi:hypothetical protein
MHRHLFACAIIGSAVLFAATSSANAEETRVQHREWMRKFSNPGGSLNGLIAAQDSNVYRVDLQSCKIGSEDAQFEAPEAC